VEGIGKIERHGMTHPPNHCPHPPLEDRPPQPTPKTYREYKNYKPFHPRPKEARLSVVNVFKLSSSLNGQFRNGIP